jgi:hypothetical protein
MPAHDSIVAQFSISPMLKASKRAFRLFRIKPTEYACPTVLPAQLPRSLSVSERTDLYKIRKVKEL